MAQIPQAIRIQPVPNGVEVIAMGRTERGTKYFMESIVISPFGEDATADQMIVEAAILQLMRHISPR